MLITLPCLNTEPPSAPQNLTVVNITNTSVFLTWEAPSSNGGRSDAELEYQLSYQRTDGSESEPQIYGRVSGTEGEITGLAPFTEYTVFVSAENGVSSQATNASGRTASVTIMTEEGSTCKSQDAHQSFVSYSGHGTITQKEIMVLISGRILCKPLSLRG